METPPVTDALGNLPLVLSRTQAGRPGPGCGQEIKTAGAGPRLMGFEKVLRCAKRLSGGVRRRGEPRDSGER